MKAGVLVGLMVLLAMQGVGAAGDEAAFLDATFSVAMPVSLDDLQERNVRSGTLASSVDCGTDRVHRLPDGTGFRFSESQDEAGCAEALFSLSLPAGAREHIIGFTSDRRVDQFTDADFPYAMVQELRIYGQSTELPSATVQLFHPRVGSQSPGVDFEESIAVADEADRVVVGFYFEDQGPVGADPASLVNPVIGQWFRATVTDIRVESRQIPAEVVKVERMTHEVGDSIEQVRHVTVDVPSTWLDAGATSLHLRGSAALELVRITGPDGQVVSPEMVRTDMDQGIADTVILPQALARHGPGQYEATLILQEPIEPELAMLPFAVAMFALPAIAGVAADRAAGGITSLRKGRKGGRFSRMAHWALLPVAALYAATFLWVALGGRWAAVTTWPLVQAGILVYASLALCLMAFLLLGYLLKRDIHRRLQKQQEEKERMNQRLAEAIQTLERSNKDLEAFAYAASHDLQEPLRKIVNYNQLVQRRYRDGLADEGKEFLDIAVHAGMRMQRVIQDLLEYSRISSDDTEHVEVELGAIVQEVLADLDDRIRSSEATIVVKDLPRIKAAPPMMRSVMQNLVVNALAYAHPDRPPMIEIEAERSRGMWRIQVSDNGQGVEEKDRERIFQAFRRGSNAHVRGTGLGLALCKRVIEEHGGRIGVERRTHGSTFWFTLPALGHETDAGLIPKAKLLALLNPRTRLPPEPMPQVSSP